MNKATIVLVLLLILVLVGGCGAFMAKNQFVIQEEGVNKAWADVEAVLQRRYDLIPNLVNTVKGFAAQEKEILEEVTRLRSRWGETHTPAERAETAGQLENALGRLLLIVERYPDLKSNQNFLALQDELAGTENRISVERRRFNEAVREYNVAIRKLPNGLWAGVFGFQPRKSFDAVKDAAVAPKVQF